MKATNRNIYATLGASNHVQEARQAEDLYCTHPDAVRRLLEIEKFSIETPIWECCDGLGHISDTLVQAGYNVMRSDLYTRGRDIKQIDFLKYSDKWEGNIITNPPYRNASEFVRHAIECLQPGGKLAIWLRILFLESIERKKLFAEHPPVRVWISSRRIPCGKEGVFGASAQGFAWYVWEKGYEGKTTLGWF